MLWIKGIEIKNYRAFRETVNVTIPDGHHLLVYGENGSGKSSLFRGVKEFFATTSYQELPFTPNRWQNDEDPDADGFVRINFGGLFDFVWEKGELHSGKFHQLPALGLINQLSEFLDYNALLPHFRKREEEENGYLFQLLTEELLAPATVVDIRTMGVEIKFGTLVAEYVKDLMDLYPAHVKVIEEQQAAALADYPEPVHEELEYPDPPFPEEKREYNTGPVFPEEHFPDPMGEETDFPEPMDEEPDLPDPLDEEPDYYPDPMDEEPDLPDPLDEEPDYQDTFDPEPDPQEPVTTPWSIHADLLSDLNDIYYELVTEVNTLSNQFLQTYFDPKLQMGIQPGKFTLEEVPETDRLEYQFNPGRANFVLYYAGKKLVDYHDFLNEARLSALRFAFG